MNRYFLFGLVIQCEFELPECLSIADYVGEPEVYIGFGHAPPEGVYGLAQGPFCQVSAGIFWLDVPGVASYLVTGGKKIIIDPAPESDTSSIRVFLLEPALNALLLQRGNLVLRASAIELGDSCLVLMGESGIGKSTIAAALHKQSNRFVSDGLVVIGHDFKVLPGPPRIKLWAKSASLLELPTSMMSRLRPKLNKFSYSTEPCMLQKSLPVSCIYNLKDSNKEVFCSPISGVKRFDALRFGVYNYNCIPAMGLQASLFAQMMRLANNIHMADVKFSRNMSSLEQIIEVIVDDAMDNSQ